MTIQMQSWAEQHFARSDPHSHARYHIELGKELLAHGFTTEAEAEFRHAATVDPSSSTPSQPWPTSTMLVAIRPRPGTKPKPRFASRSQSKRIWFWRDSTCARIEPMRRPRTSIASYSSSPAILAQDLKRTLQPSSRRKRTTATGMKTAFSRQSPPGFKWVAHLCPHFLVALFVAASSPRSPKVVVDDAIQPVTAEYIGRALETAAANHDQAVLIDSTRPADSSTRRVRSSRNFPPRPCRSSST